MKKRLSILLIGTAVSVVAVVGAFAGIAAAQSNDGDGDGQSFVERVATILGISSDDVESAFEQATEEMHEERIDAKFAELVENGTLTQEEADAIKEWQDAKPEIEFSFEDADGERRRGRGHEGFGRGGHWLGSTEKLDYLVEEGVISQADADSLTEWWDSRPEVIDDLMPERGEKRGHHGKHGGMKRDRQDSSEESETSTTSDIDA